MAEKRAGFAVDALAFTAGGEGQQKDEEDGKRQFALTNKGLGGKMEVFRGKTVGNELKKSIQNRCKLA
jgi:hypothetical protein